MGCGQPVPDQPDQAHSDQPTVAKAVAERRQLSVIFSDLVGSTALSELLDPEDYRELIAHYRRVVTDIVTNYGGHVTSFVGDGVVIYFGYPVAQEGSAYAAALTALDIVATAPEIAEHFPSLNQKIEVRVGMDIGSVVVGETGQDEHIEKISLFGDTPNIAARIQSQAQPGQVVVSATARRLIGSKLVFTSLGNRKLAGVSKPMELFIVRRPDTSLEMVNRHHLHPATPMIGRNAEVALVETRWETAVEFDGQVMVLTGEAGIGKSRIMFSLEQVLSKSEANQITLFGSIIRKNSAFYSIKIALIEMMGLSDADGDDHKRQKLDVFLDQLGLDPALVAPPLAGLLRFSRDSDQHNQASSPEREKSEIINAIFQLCDALASEKPLLMMVDDAHWIDASTLEFLSHWVDALPRRRCLLLVTARPEFISPWKNRAHATALELNRFGRRETIALIENIAGIRPAEALLDQIVLRTDGVPLFIEELTKMVIDTGIISRDSEFNGNLSHAIPESLQDSLMARLDRLAAVREVAQVAAAIGRTFTRTVLSKVQGYDETIIEEKLAQLIDADLIVPLPEFNNEPSYRFRHALVQDAAYQSMLRTSRATWHARIAEVLQQDFPDTVQHEPEILGHHFLLAGDHGSAEQYWLSAARMAMVHSANVEAIEHLQHALECLDHTPESEERDRREMDMRIMIAVPYASVNGYAHQSVKDTYTRASELCRQHGELEQLCKVVYGQFRSSMLGGEYAGALENIKILDSLLEEFDDPLLTAATQRSLGSVLTYLGKPDEAIEHLNKGLSTNLSYDDRKRGLDFDVVDLLVALHAYSAWSNWLIGRTDDARASITNALDCAREVDHPFSIAFSLAFASWIYQFTGDEEALRSSSAQLVAYSEENNFKFWLGWGRVMNGWARRNELGEKTLTIIQDGLKEWRDTGSRLGLSYFLYLYADTALSLGKTEKAEELISEAEAFQEQSGEAFWKPALICLRAEVALARGNHASAMENLSDAIVSANENGLHGLQLGAATRFAKVAGEQDKTRADTVLREALKNVSKNEQASNEAQKMLKKLAADAV